MEATRRVGHSPAMRGIPSVADENGGQGSLFSGRSKAFMEVEDSASVRSIHDQCVGIWLLSFCEPLPEHHHKSNEFEGSEQSVVILPIDNDVIIRR